MGTLISGTFWEMYRSSDGMSIGCLTAPAIVRFEESEEGSRAELKHLEGQLRCSYLK